MQRLIVGAAVALSLGAASIGSAVAQQAPPPGSYQRSCTHIHMRGPMLIARCTDPSGNRMRSELNVNRCRPGADIANIDGRLRCRHRR